MTARDTLAQTKAILQAAFDALTWPTGLSIDKPRVQLGAPLSPTARPTWCYLLDEGTMDDEKTTHGWVRRTRLVGIHLMIAVGQDEETTENLFADLAEVVEGAFYTNRKLNGAAASSAIKQRDARGGGANDTYRKIGEEHYFRARAWSLEVKEDRDYQMQ